MALHQHGRSRRRLRLRTPENERDDGALMIGDRMAGIPANPQGTGGAPADRGRGSASSTPPGGGAASGDGASGMPRLELERVSMEEERPEMDRQAVNRNRWLTIASSALSGLGALSDSPELAKAGEGLATGFAQANRRRRKAFFNELSNFRDRRQSMREENLRRERTEAEANFEAQLADAKQDRQLQNQLEKIDQRYDRKLELIREKEEREPTEVERMRAKAERTQAKADLIEARQEKQDAQFGGDSGDSDQPPLPSTMEGVDRQLLYWKNLRQNGIQETNTFGEPYRRQPDDDELQTIQNNINRLRRRRRQLQQQDGGGKSPSPASRGDATEPGADDAPMSSTATNSGATEAARRSAQARATADSSQGQAQRSTGQGQQASPPSMNKSAQRARRNLTQALQSENPNPEQVMQWAREARKAGGITKTQFRKLRNFYGQQ